ncbi:zinc finger and SCAN domain-containing protein 29-like [Hetaerina americana]|uniref:zinc finger and SCAN domain-containing protein 29-like n=1 Tax=Hetaerina americana TaxID=62018 RepID=UPI003A7F5F07
MATKNRGLAWCLAETQLLIDLWSENSTINEQDGTCRNAAVYLNIAKQLEDSGFHRTTAQIRDRMKRLKRDYREVVDNNNKPEAAGRKTCHFFYELDRIFGRGTFSNSNVEHDNSTSLPVNVCSAELGKSMASDEDEDASHALRTQHSTPNGLVYRSETAQNTPDVQPQISKKRLKKRIQAEEVLHKEPEIVEDRSVNTDDMVGLEVEKLMLEMEKLREETGRIREERSKLALEKEILVLQKRRLLREERECREMRMRQSKMRRVDPTTNLPGDLGDVNILAGSAAGISWRRDEANCLAESEAAEYHETDGWERTSVSSSRGLTSQTLAVDPASFTKEIGLRGMEDGVKVVDVQGSTDDVLQVKQKHLGGLSTESLEDGSRISPNSNGALLISQVESIGWDGGFCGFLNNCQNCGHVTPCNRPVQDKKED